MRLRTRPAPAEEAITEASTATNNHSNTVQESGNSEAHIDHAQQTAAARSGGGGGGEAIDFRATTQRLGILMEAESRLRGRSVRDVTKHHMKKLAKELYAPYSFMPKKKT
jgi:hypothetical protein